MSRTVFPGVAEASRLFSGAVISILALQVIWVMAWKQLWRIVWSNKVFFSTVMHYTTSSVQFCKFVFWQATSNSLSYLFSPYHMLVLLVGIRLRVLLHGTTYNNIVAITIYKFVASNDATISWSNVLFIGRTVTLSLTSKNCNWHRIGRIYY